MMCSGAAAQWAGGHTEVALREDVFEIACVRAVDAEDDVARPEGGPTKTGGGSIHNKINGLDLNTGTCSAC